jgi:hypothetical protein
MINVDPLTWITFIHAVFMQDIDGESKSGESAWDPAPL